MKVAAIDIGVGGGFAWIEETLIGKQVKTEKMPDSIKGIQELVRRIPVDCFAIEGVTIRPNDLKDGRIYRIVDTMIRNIHTLETVMELNDKKYFKISPQRWQFPHKLNIKGMEYADRKLYFKETAARLFTKTKVVGWNADALMILNHVFIMTAAQDNWLRDQGSKLSLKFW